MYDEIAVDNVSQMITNFIAEGKVDKDSIKSLSTDIVTYLISCLDDEYLDEDDDDWDDWGDLDSDSRAYYGNEGWGEDDE